MKKLLVLLAVICLLLTSTVMGIGTVASAAEESPLADFMIFDGVLEEYIGPGGDVVIPASAGIVEISAKAFYENKDITSVIIPEGITTIGLGAFGKASNLAKVQLPYSLEKMGNGCFESTMLSEVTIPGKVEIIPLWSFCGLESLNALTLSYGVREIHTQAFYNCKAPEGNLKKVVFPETVELICGASFGGQHDREPVEYIICNPDCEIGYWDDNPSGEPNLNHNWQATLLSPFYSAYGEMRTKVVVPENSEIAKFLKENGEKLFTDKDIPGSLNVIEKSESYFKGLNENQPTYGIQSPITNNTTEQGGGDAPIKGGNNDPVQGDGDSPAQGGNGTIQNDQQGSNQSQGGAASSDSGSLVTIVIIIVAGVIVFAIIIIVGIIVILFVTGKMGGKKKSKEVTPESPAEETTTKDDKEASELSE